MSEYRNYCFDDAKDYVAKHMMALTDESLYDKGEIATELAWRDFQIDELQSQNTKLREALELIIKWSDNVNARRATTLNPRDIAQQAINEIRRDI